MKLELNAKTYEIEGFTFGTLCALEERKINITDLTRKPMSFLRDFIGLQTGLDRATVEKEITEHIVNGGSLETLMDTIEESLEESGFFQKLVGTAPKDKQKKKPSKSNA